MIFYAIGIFLSSFLLFQIQPLISKYILPWYGGTTGVWSASLLFFQVLLTGGYTYTHLLIRRMGEKKQSIIHLTLLGLSLILLGLNISKWTYPILPPPASHIQDVRQPLFDVLFTLLIAVGMPYFLLSTNSTLMQAWYTKTYLDKSPYWLYAVSNIGSFIGLITYPIFFEPNFTLETQSIIWSGAYLIYLLIVGYRAWGFLRNDKANKIIVTKDENINPVDRPALKQYIKWIGLSSLASIFLLATTSRITQEVAVIPFLWVLPLTVYLLTFVLSFSNDRWYSRKFYSALLSISTILFMYIVITPNVHYFIQIAIYILLLFSFAMICHGELYASRPAAEYLTTFYLWVSVGGAIGGVMVNFIAPYIFNGYWEFQIGLIIIWIIILIYLIFHPNSRNILNNLIKTAGVGLITFFLIGILYINVQAVSMNVVESSRNFYGVLRVVEHDSSDPLNHRYSLTHGITNHGFQYQHPDKRTLPTSYFTEDTGVGLAFTNYPTDEQPINVGIIGLGIGVQAVYGREGDHFRFYEINPTVVEIAQSDFFSYLSDSPAEIEIILGDGRISLEQELISHGSNNFDLLVLDAFNSDSVPTHLLTKEAFSLYLQHLKPQGILALNISNRYLNLRPAIWILAEHFGLDGIEINNVLKDPRSFPASWILLTSSQTFLQNPNVLRAGTLPPRTLPDYKLWTDNYSNLFQLLY